MKMQMIYKRIGSITIILLLLCGSLLGLTPAVWSATSDADFTLDDGVGDSPQIFLRDQGNEDLTIQKLDAGDAEIINTEGALNLKFSADIDDYIQFLTVANAPYIYWLLNGYTNYPGLRIDPGTGKLQYRDEDAAGWINFDDLGGAGGVANLDEAYDGGGAGAGRTVTVDQNAVQFTG
ncbi:MAG: hypothetical protein JXD21_07080, partial [Candidatus Omnitrophica bacterium]|nr:hypothetical protein [Candidatus Omnitrophota bacterium]